MWPDASVPRAPLGLPPGSVRALLALLVLAVVGVETARDNAVDLFWSGTLLIVVAHYFSSRRGIKVAEEVHERLEADGALIREQPPLFLPRHSVRAIILLTMVGLGAWMFRQGRFDLLDVRNLGPLDVFLVLAIYLLGAVWHGIVNLGKNRRTSSVSPRWSDFKALLVLLLMAAVAIVWLSGRADILPAWAHKISLGLTLFYFGSR